MRRLLLIPLLFASACRGTVPERNGPPEQAISAILLGCRMILPTGETRNGYMSVNFESSGGRQAEVYRLPLRGGENYLYLVEPGTYRLAPTRSVFGYYQTDMKVVIEGRAYRLPFPRDVLRQPAYEVRPSKIVSIGIVEAKVMPALPGQKPTIRVRIDDTITARRTVVQQEIRTMMDPRGSLEARESAIAWTRALQNILVELLAEEQQRQTYKPAQ